MSRSNKKHPHERDTLIVQCNCEHAYQDSKYGRGRRIGTPVMRPEPSASCTVCGRVHDKYECV